VSFSVLFPTDDRRLVTAAEVNAMIGQTVTDEMILQASDLISRECRIAAFGVTPPTLRQEDVEETLRLATSRREIVLSRRFIKMVLSVTIDGSALSADGYEVNGEAGILLRVGSTGDVTCWDRGKIVVNYRAGFETVPEPLKLATIRVLQEQLSASDRDPLLRGETVEGIGRFDYWVNGAAGVSARSPLSGAVAAMLDPYRSIYV
jgi:hypothetical protein